MPVVHVCPHSLFILFHRVWIMNMVAFFKQDRVTYRWGTFVQPLMQGKHNQYYIFWGREVSSMQCTCTILSSVTCLALPHFSTLIHKWHIFCKKKLLPIKYTFWLSTNFVWNFSHSKKNWARHYHKCTYLLMQSTCYSCQILMKLQFSWQILKKLSNIKFHENPFSGSWVVPCERTDRRD